ncbi:PREDICTED: subtilisin-like protease SBT1.5 [Camelina sativa]|uniref:Subtilisin-like protease SBT1.5 n=1 Tax=Camelina sativa TaxID=90675 RepID=A0ABM0XKB1_CAMSA|nr:PREDICTED: subtilisin-like protease SBT1.5 [Camelina sativa]
MALFFLFLVLLTLLSPSSSSSTNDLNSLTYIIHVDHEAKPSIFPTHRHWYTSSIASLTSTTPSIIHTYDIVFHGFSARLTIQTKELKVHMECFEELLCTFSYGAQQCTATCLSKGYETGNYRPPYRRPDKPFVCCCYYQ